MLGDGRPFVLELLHPRKRVSASEKDLEAVSLAINGQGEDVEVRGLGFTDKSCFEALTKAADTKVKAYGAIVQTDRPLTEEKIKEVNKLENVEIDQMTPLRVLHRRTLMSRDKMIFRCLLRKINEFTAVCFLLSSAGTYIKEFVHGDLNRTKPNLGLLLGCRCDILQLDVIQLYEEMDEGTIEAFEELARSFLL